MSSSSNYIQKKLCFNACRHDTESVNQQTPATSTSELNKPNSKRKVGIKNRKVKKKEWNDDYIKCGFFLPQSKELSIQPSAQCMLCSITYENRSLVPLKLHNHLENKHSIHRNKSKQFFNSFAPAIID